MSMSGQLISVLDARELGEQNVRVGRWAQTLGLVPRDVHRIELYFDGRLIARVHAWKRDEQGHLFCERNHDHLDFAEDCKIAAHDPYDVTVISAAGARALNERMRTWADAMRSVCPALAPVLAIVRACRRDMRTEYARRRRARARRIR